MCFRKGKVLVIFSRYEHFVRFGQVCFRNIRNVHVIVGLRGDDMRYWGSLLMLTCFVYFQRMDFLTFRMLRDIYGDMFDIRMRYRKGDCFREGESVLFLEQGLLQVNYPVIQQGPASGLEHV